MAEMVRTYKGKPLDTLTWAELLDALHHVCRQLDEQRWWANEDREIERLFADTKVAMEQERLRMR